MMGREARTRAGEAATKLILSTFRANGLLLDAGDLLTAGEELTTARWQVLGALALADRPLTVPQIARRMGLTRQSVHATVNRLVRDGVLELAPNEDHRRSALVGLTKEGLATYEAIDARQVAWINRLAHGIPRSDIETAVQVIDELCRRLEDDRRGETDTRKDIEMPQRMHEAELGIGDGRTM
jgi:DNA-binding MarR family transcriptional regulator